MFRFFCFFCCIALAHASRAQQPLLNRVASFTQDRVFDTRAWRFDAGAPVRSTPLLKDNKVYIGTASGELLCLDAVTGFLKWKFTAGAAIHSSATASGGLIYFADNTQKVYAVTEQGKLAWSFVMGKKIGYPWRFDYYYSSPVIHDGSLYIGGDDGWLYKLNAKTGKQEWKFKARGLVRSTVLPYKNNVLFGDTEAGFYSVDRSTGKEQWRFAINGDTMKNENYGFDRRAINASAAVSGNTTVVGARDGYLYAVNADNGTLLWKVDHNVSWIISTVAIKDNIVVTGTSDGRFVQAVDLQTGKEIWKYRTGSAVWASPLIENNKVYAGCFDGQLLCLDLQTGKRLSAFSTGNQIFSSPVINGDKLFVGSDDGNIYALKSRRVEFVNTNLQRYVYHESQVRIYHRNGSDTRIKNYLNLGGYKTIGPDTIAKILADTTDARNAVIAVVAGYFPAATWKNGVNSLIRQFLEAGGRIVLAGNNPLFYDVDEKAKQITALSFTKADSVFGFHYGFNDTRSFGGLMPSFPTEAGKNYNLPDHWICNFGLDEKHVNIVLGNNENGQVTSFVKNYGNGGRLVQIWLHPDAPTNLDAIVKLGESKLE